MAEPKIWEFQVTGGGSFPFDMLRYDTCWPAKETEVGNIEPYRVTLGTVRTITLRGLKKPTDARWESFGWKIINIRKVN